MNSRCDVRVPGSVFLLSVFTIFALGVPFAAGMDAGRDPGDIVGSQPLCHETPRRGEPFGESEEGCGLESIGNIRRPLPGSKVVGVSSAFRGEI